MGKFLGGLVALILIVVIAIFAFKGCSPNSGFGTGTKPDTISTEKTDDTEQRNREKQDISIADTIIIKIKENKVFIGKKEFKDAKELSMYLEETNVDELTYELEEEHSILETHEWVVEVFESLQIPLKITK